jgi:hypothetical protein
MLDVHDFPQNGSNIFSKLVKRQGNRLFVCEPCLPNLGWHESQIHNVTSWELYTAALDSRVLKRRNSGTHKIEISYTMSSHRILKHMILVNGAFELCGWNTSILHNWGEIECKCIELLKEKKRKRKMGFGIEILT